MSEGRRFTNIQDIIDARMRDFTGADLQGADLIDADLEHYIFVGANFQGANLQSAFLTGADLRGANLEGANLEDATLQDANLENANLRNANLRMAFFGEGFDLPNVAGANLEGANLEGILGTTADDLLTLANAAPARIANQLPPTPWIQDEDCVGQEDPVTIDNIPNGRGFRLEAENRCYDALTLAEMRRLDRPFVGPMTRIPFTQNDIRRIDQFRRDNPNLRATGGKKRKTRKIRKSKRKTRKTKISKKRNTKRRKNN